MSESKIKKVLLFSIIPLLIILFVLIFFLYDSPAYYVKTPSGSIYLDQKGEPIIYYKDIFGRDFYNEDGKRAYATVPDSIEPITDPEDLAELQESINQD